MKLDKMLYASYMIIAIWLWILYRSFSEGHVVNIWTYRVVIILLIINVIKMITDIKIVRISKLIVNTQIMKYIGYK